MSDEQSSTGPSHHPGTRKGEEMAGKGEPGRENEGTSHADRPTGGSSSRMSTGINPDKEDPIDDNSPSMPPA